MKNTVKGDLVLLAKRGEFDVIVHGQNCFHGWKKGIANTIGLHFPATKKADLATMFGDKKKMGTFSFADVVLENGKYLTIANAYTQFKFGQGVHLNMIALERSLTALRDAYRDKHIAYPKIGSGHAGGDWKAISAVIDRVFESATTTLVVY